MNNKIFQRNYKNLSEDKSILKNLLDCNSRDESTTDASKEKMEFGAEEIAGRTVLFAVSKERVFRLGSLYDDEILSECWISQIKGMFFNSKLLMFGIGNGMYIRKFLDKVPKTEGIIIYEPSLELFRHVMNSIDISDILGNPRIHIYVEGVENLITKDFLYKYIVYSDIKGLIFHDYMNYKNLFPEKFSEFFIECQTLINSINATNIVWERFGESYYQNTLRNLPHFLASRSLHDLYLKLPKNIPVIIVAAGPSLDKNILHLKQAQGKALIIAVDSALRALLKNDIIPDLFVTIDGRKLAAHFDDPRVSGIPVICNFNSNADVLDLHSGVKYFINDMNPHINHILNQLGMQMPIASTGGSVANTAFSLSQTLGFTKIIMIGQDLAYTDNRTHASDTLRGTWNIDITSEDYVEVEGYYGGKVRSSNEFWLYLDWFQKELSIKPEITMINATEGGARIAGSVQMPLLDAIQAECKDEIEINKIFENSEYFLNYDELLLFIEKLKKSADEMKSILEYAQKSIRIHYSMLELINANKYRNSEMDKMFRQTKELGEKIEKVPSMYYIECRIQNKINELTNDIYSTIENEYEDIKEATKKSLKYFEIIVEATKSTLPDFEKRIQDGIEKAYLIREQD